ncbi:MAG: hypothetical protein IH602_04455, partial [Bryobacteraceae bacterium]|nr:hypothetical protein [Bryobacteraceae bacterium]
MARTYELPERQFWALTIGGDGAFESEADARAAWFAHRHELITNPCTRAAGWWQFESVEARTDESEPIQLERMGALTIEERGHLARWRALGVI